MRRKRKKKSLTMFILLFERLHTGTGRPPWRTGQLHCLRLSSGQTVHLQQETARHKRILSPSQNNHTE